MRRKFGDGVEEAAIMHLRQAGLRPTRQRGALAKLLFAHGNRHLTAETLHAEAVSEGIKVSLATVYNTLHQFTEAGLLREVVVDATRSYFDTNTGEHQHFYCEDEGKLTDIPASELSVGYVPTPPSGMEVSRVDVVVRVRRHSTHSP
jgi:Fur family iron response transcriptional regulator